MQIHKIDRPDLLRLLSEFIILFASTNLLKIQALKMDPAAQQAIPSVDLSAFTTESDIATRWAAATELARSCQSHGYVGIVGHGVPHDVLQEAFSFARRLFALPMEDKMKAPHPKAMIPHRGYSAPGREKTFSLDEALNDSEETARAKKQILDIHETYECGNENNLVQTNIWLPEHILPGFREFSMKFFWQLHECGRTILEALMMGLNLAEEERESLRKLHSGYSEQLRYAHYPSVSLDAINRKELNRLPEHTDYSSFTLLFQDDSGGLEFKSNTTGAFVPAIPDGDKLYLNIGDMFMRITNGMCPAATHRVSISQSDIDQGSRVTKERYSIPFFFSPHADMIAAPLRTCITEDNPARFEPIKISDYAAERSKWQYENRTTVKP
ncbi:MAG: hypothetical protein M1821_005744 [Bathelium mastoideum]|nr:MAG: hypothetical protein M1821_005744 [Bathelium mastoideum]